jgi:hypothetical protein
VYREREKERERERKNREKKIFFYFLEGKKMEEGKNRKKFQKNKKVIKFSSVTL